MKKSILLFAFLSCFSLSIIAQVLFEEHNIAENDVAIARLSFSADLDNDGDLDIITVFDEQIIWYENEDGLGTFMSQRLITNEVDGAISVHATDMDGDGDMDVLSASSLDDKIAWYENEDGLGNFGDQQIITTFIDFPYSVHAGDMDGDGDMDVLSASIGDKKLAWYENEDGQGTFGDQQIISTGLSEFKFVNASDFDSDGDLDVIYATSYAIGWYENEDGLGTMGGNNESIDEWGTIQSVHIADLDGDSDMDVFYITEDGTAKDPNYRSKWYENLDGLGTFNASPNQAIGSWESQFSVFVSDLDGDGDNDLIFTFENSAVWYENIDGQGSFNIQTPLIPGLGGNISAADIDGDGAMDIIATSHISSVVAWYKNELGIFADQQIIHTPFIISGPNSNFTADLDGDGDMDVLSTSQNNDKIVWFENNDGQGSFHGFNNITTNADGATSVFSTDLDGDGDMDVLSASQFDNKIAWYENEDGLGNFGDEKIITTNAIGASSVYAMDLDNDGDMDVLSASFEDDKIAWYENEDGLGTFGDEKIITTNADGASSVYSTDIDGDGDLDVLSASQFDDKIAWYENEDGLGTFGSQQIITTYADGANDVYTIDLDGDNDMDVLSASMVDGKIAWYENEDGLGTFGSHQIITTSAAGASSVFAADIDDDGDLDVLSASPNDNKLAWYENINGLGAFASQTIITQNVEGANSVYASDLDGDGDLDVLSTYSTNNKIIWHETLGIDSEAPIAVCQNISIILNESGSAGISVSDIDNGSTDNFSIESYEINESVFTCDELGSNNVTLTITDIGGNVGLCTSIVTVNDTTPPIVVTQNILVNLAGALSVVITPDQIDNGSTDNCSITELSLDQNTFDAPGEYAVNLSVTDNSGNVSTVGASVMVLDITAPPVAMCQDVSILLSSSGTADIELADIDNNSLNDDTIESLEINQNEFTCADLGANEVTLSVTDVLGNTGTCIAIVTVVDNFFTYLNTQNITIDLAGESSVTITPDQINNGSVDNCEIISMTLDQDTFTEVGEFEVLFTATDIGNNSKSEIAIVTVINSVVGVEDLNNFEKNLSIHPIPTTDQITIKAPNNITQINIYNTQGQLLLSQNTNDVSISNINLTNLATGLYFCEVKDNTGNVGVRKIIKK